MQNDGIYTKILYFLIHRMFLHNSNKHVNNLDIKYVTSIEIKEIFI